MLPDLQLADLRSGGPAVAGALVEVEPGATSDVTLHWQQWTLRSASLDRVAAAITGAAPRHLVAPS